MPLILDNKKKARDIDMKEYLKVDTERSLGLLRSVMGQLNRIDDHIAHLIKESDDMSAQKDVLANQLIQLGLSADRIKEITDMKKERPWCRTAEREKLDAAQERKRKAEEEKWDKAKKQRVVATVEGEENLDYELKTPEKEKEEEDHESKLRRQQKQIIEQQEQLIQRQEAELMRKQLINQQEQMLVQEPIIVQPRNVQQTDTAQPGTSAIKTGGQSTIDRFLSPRSMQYLRGLPLSSFQIQKAQQVQCQEVQQVQELTQGQIQGNEQSVQPGDMVISEPILLEQPQIEPPPTVYILKASESRNIVLIATPAKKSTPL